MTEWESISQSRIFDTFCRLLPTPAAILDVRGNLLEVNGPFADVLSQPITAVIGQQWTEILSPKVNPAFEAALRSKKPVYLSRCVFHSFRPPSCWDCAIFPVCDAAGNVEKVILSLMDITHQAQAGQQPVQSKEYVDLLLDMMEDTVVTVRYPERVIEYCNYALERMFGYAVHEVLGASTRMLYADEKGFEDFRRLFEQTMRSGGHRVQADVLMKRKSGETFWANIIATFPLGPDNPQHAIGVIRDITEQKKAEEQLSRSRQQLRILYRRLQETRDEEQSRIARELHDTIGQTLTGLKIDVSLLEQDILQMQQHGMDEALQRRIDGINKLIDSAMETVHSISAELRIGILESMGFGGAVRWQALEFEKKFGITTLCDISEADWNSLGNGRARALFRILQEALTNVARHARASHVWISVRKQNSGVELEVVDDGIGYDPAHVTDQCTLGLVGMSERAAAFGGSFQISARREGGTCVRASMPTISTLYP